MFGLEWILVERVIDIGISRFGTTGHVGYGWDSTIPGIQFRGVLLYR